MISVLIYFKHKSKSIRFLLIFFFTCFQTLCQQSTINGIVSVFNSKTNTGTRQYISNAQIIDDSARAQPTVTDNEGKFKLIYVGIDDKNSVSFQVKKLGLQVVNIDALSAITGQNDIVKISMAPPNSINAYRIKIYNIGKTTAQKFLEELIRKKSKQIIDLRKGNLQNQDRINQLQQDLSQLEDKQKKVEAQAEDLAKRYAQINLDDVSSLFKDAFILFQNGNLDSAQSLLSHANFRDKVNLLLEEETKIEQGKKEFNERDSLTRKRKEEYQQSLQLKADLHKTRYQYSEALECYELLIRLDSSNTSTQYNYAYFLQWHNEYNKSIWYYLKCLSSYRNQYKISLGIYDAEWIASIQLNLGIIYSLKNNFEPAELALREALLIYEALAEYNFPSFGPALGDVQMGLGHLYNITKDSAKAESAYLESSQIYTRLGETNSLLYEPNIAQLQNNLGNFYKDHKLYSKAKVAFNISLDIYQRLASKDSQTYNPSLAGILDNVGVLYSLTDSLNKALSYFLTSLKIYQLLDKGTPGRYDYESALLEDNIGTFYRTLKKYSQAEEAYLKSLNIFKRLASVDSQTYEVNVSNVQTNLGNLYLETQKYTEAEHQLIESLKTRAKWMNQYPKVYQKDVTETAKKSTTTILVIIIYKKVRCLQEF